MNEGCGAQPVWNSLLWKRWLMLLDQIAHITTTAAAGILLAGDN